MDLENLVVRFSAETSNLTSGVAGVKTLLAGFGLAAIGVGVASAKMAGQFQASMTQLVTGAGESRKNIGMLSQGVLDMARQTGTSTSQLTSGLFMIESASYRGSQGLQVLKVAAEGAKVGNSDLATTSMAMISVMKDYHMNASQAGDAMNFLTGIVQNGTTTMQDLASSIHGVLPTASSLGVNLKDVGGAMATMTGETVPAADAATYLRQMLMSLAAPATAGQKALKAIGLSAGEVSADMKKSLPDTLKLIMQHLAETYKVGSPQYVEAMKNIAGGSKQMQGFLDLTGSHLKEFGNNVNSVSSLVNKGKGSVVGWGDVQQTFNFKMDQARATVETLMITLGTKLLPILSPLVDNIAKAASAFTGWLNSAHPLTDILSLTGKYSQIALPIIAAVGAVVLATVVPAFIAWAAATLAATWPLILIGAAVGAVVALFVHFYQTIPGFRAAIDGIANGLKNLAGFFMSAGNSAEAMRLKALEAHNKMAIDADTKGAKTAQNAIKHAEEEKVGILRKLKETHDPAEKAELEHQLKMVNYQIQANQLRLQKIEEDKKIRLQKQKELQAQLEEAQKSGFQKMLDAMGTWFGNVFSAIGTFFHKIVTNIGNYFNQLGTTVHIILTGIGDFFSAFGTKVHDIIGKVGDFFSGLGTNLHNIIGKIGDVFSGLGNTVHNIWNGIMGAVKNAVNFIIGLINNFIGGIDNIHVNVPGVGNVGFNIPKIPLLEKGGYVPPGSMAIAGETGKPEIVLGGTSGASVLGVSQTSSLMAHSQQPIQVHVHNYIDGREMANTTMIRTISEMRNGHPVGMVA